ncbi:MAG: hypothetical protein ACI9DF_004242, partial [Verrucomicrobiales bacterium]
MERLLDRAVGLYGKRPFGAGVWIKRFRAFCYESGHVGVDVIPLAKAYLSMLSQWRDLEPWQEDQASLNYSRKISVVHFNLLVYSVLWIQKRVIRIRK